MNDYEQKRLEYFAFALEVFKEHRGISGKEAFCLLRETDADSFIYDLYETLHVHGEDYLIEELDSYFLSCVGSVAELQPKWNSTD